MTKPIAHRISFTSLFELYGCAALNPALPPGRPFATIEELAHISRAASMWVRLRDRYDAKRAGSVEALIRRALDHIAIADAYEWERRCHAAEEGSK